MVTGLSQFLDRDEGNGGTLLVDDMSGTLARLASKKEVASRRAGMTDQGNAIGLMESRVIDRPLLGRDRVRGIEGRELAFHQTPKISGRVVRGLLLQTESSTTWLELIPCEQCKLITPLDSQSVKSSPNVPNMSNPKPAVSKGNCQQRHALKSGNSLSSSS